MILTFAGCQKSGGQDPTGRTDVVVGCNKWGMFCDWAEDTLSRMQLIQIGENRQKTVLDMVVEMADRQFAEMQKLKTAAHDRSKTRRTRLSTPRCGSSNRPQ